MYIALSLVKKFDTTDGRTVNVINDAKRLIGCCYVFETKAAARELFGYDVGLQEIDFAEPTRKK